MGSITDRLRPEQIAKAAPVCPDCGTPLIFRPEDRRFPEDNRYVQYGHVWELQRPDEVQKEAQRRIEELETDPNAGTWG